MYRNRGRTRIPSFAMFLLINELIRSATTYGIPTITCASIVAQILIFLRIIPFISSNVWNVCLSVDSILRKKEYMRLIASRLTHSDEWHLYYNMVSFLWKGRSLERRLGTIPFLITLIVFTVCTSFTYLILNQLVAQITEDYSYLNHCSVGFSGVIFALKVLTTHYDMSEVSYLMGIPIGSKYAVWAELVLIQLISPNVSFVGHLAGILVGLAYIYGPLFYVIQSLNAIIQPLIGNSNSNSNSNTWSRQTSRHSYQRRTHSYESYIPSGMTEDEQLRRATEESLLNSRSNSYPTAPPYPTDDNFGFSSDSNERQTNNYDAETIRRLRLRHYQN